MIQELEKSFIGSSEVKGFSFELYKRGKHSFIYKCYGGGIYYEVFERKIVPLCIDFENRIYSETDFKEVYPKSEDFGKWAWTYKNHEQANNKFNEIEEYAESKSKTDVHQ